MVAHLEELELLHAVHVLAPDLQGHTSRRTGSLLACRARLRHTAPSQSKQSEQHVERREQASSAESTSL